MYNYVKVREMLIGCFLFSQIVVFVICDKKNIFQNKNERKKERK